MSKIILASASQRRRELLEKMGFDFDVITSDCIEEILTTNPKKETMRLSRLKLTSLLNSRADLKDSTIIAADTLVSLGKKIIGKSNNIDEAKNILKLLSGKTHSVVTGVTVYKNGKIISKCCVSNVTFCNIDEDLLNWYFSFDEWKGVAGGYRIQGLGEIFAKKINGSFSNIVGLPSYLTLKLLK